MLKFEKQIILTEAADENRSAALPKCLKIPSAVRYSAIGRSCLYELISSGKVKSYKIGASRLVDRESLDQFISSHAA